MNEIQILLANWMSALAVLLPFGYSFGAGMVSTVNPCGFSLLPAYLSLYLGGRDEGTASSHLLLRGGKALLIGTAVTLGFSVLFSLVGMIIWAGGYILMQYTLARFVRRGYPGLPRPISAGRKVGIYLSSCPPGEPGRQSRISRVQHLLFIWYRIRDGLFGLHAPRISGGGGKRH